MAYFKAFLKDLVKYLIIAIAFFQYKSAIGITKAEELPESTD